MGNETATVSPGQVEVVQATLNPLRIALFAPVESRLNPYAQLLRQALANASAGNECHLENWFSMRWLLNNWARVDILHFHWLEYTCRGDSRIATYRRFVLLLIALCLAKFAGLKIVYTVHNAVPHANDHAVLNHLTNRVMFAIADAIHVHDNRSGEEIGRLYGRRRDVFEIPHGSYIDAYPNSCSREWARSKLGIPRDNFVYLFLGQLRPNKGLEDLIAAFCRLRGDGASLLIAGWAPSEDYRRQIQEATTWDTRISAYLEFVPDEELQLYYSASDICVLPYKQVTTSGAALLAFSFGKAIIAPRLGCFHELVQENSGILYDAEQSSGLLNALQAGRELDLSKAGEAALSLARNLDWQSIGEQHLEMYREITRAGTKAQGR